MKEIKSKVSGIMVFRGDNIQRFYDLEINTKKGQSVTSAVSYHLKQKGYSGFKLRDLDIQTIVEQGTMF